jgi:hypothetical protein
MPTGKDTLNPDGLVKAARDARERQAEAQARAQAAADMLLSQLADSEEFAAQFDEAVMREDRDRILALIAEAGVSDETEVTIVELDPDRMIQIKFCVWVFCISVTFSW